MEAYLDTAIKDVITEFPEVGTILEGYGIGCVPCQVGTCLLKDVVAIHNLSPEAEREAMARIAGVIALKAGGADHPVGSAVPKQTTGPLEPGPAPDKTEIKYSPPLRELVEEHVLIMRWVALIPALLERMDLERPEDRALLLDGVEFVRSYADRYHHAKEEDILFGYFDQTREIIQAMLTDHEAARAHTRQVAEAVEARDRATVADHLNAYGELLRGHIKREDEILYPWMDRELTTGQVGELFSRFAGVDQTAGEDFTDRCTTIVTRVERWVGMAQTEPDAAKPEATRQKVEATL